ncbi:MAG TPA: superoxide dismutase family protein [Thermomicrobiales bacterium]
MRRLVATAFVAFLALALSGTASLAQDATPEATPDGTPVGAVQTRLIDAQGQEVGTATFLESNGGVSIVVELNPGALEPGQHGIHVHEIGICDPSGPEPFASAGGHYNPTGEQHGAPMMATPGVMPTASESHAGDLGNLTVEADGSARLETTTDRFTLDQGPTGLNDADGSAIVIHAEEDDPTMQPSGGSGGRLICGVIFPPMTDATPGASPVTTG